MWAVNVPMASVNFVNGAFVEEHDNIPSFREHDVRFVCASCSEEWDFGPGLSTRDWRLDRKTA